MSNGNLNCSATNCGHNNSGLCYAGGINVGGHNANTTSNTYCSSFVDQDNTYFTNIVYLNNFLCQDIIVPLLQMLKKAQTVQCNIHDDTS